MKYQQNQTVVLVHPFLEDEDPKTTTARITNYREVGNSGAYTYFAEGSDGTIYQSTPCCDGIITPTYFASLNAASQSRLLGYFDFDEMSERLHKRHVRLKELLNATTDRKKAEALALDIKQTYIFLEKLTYHACVCVGGDSHR